MNKLDESVAQFLIRRILSANIKGSNYEMEIIRTSGTFSPAKKAAGEGIADLWVR